MDFKQYIKELNINNSDLKRDINWLGCYLFKCAIHDLDKQSISLEQKKSLDEGLKKLKQHIPLAYIINYAPFFGKEFFVDESVLIPRMETELLVEKIINENKNKKQLKILDLCTGSGCIAITLKEHLDCVVTASDVSKKALNTAKTNAKKHKVEIEFINSNMFEKINQTFDIIVSNPPYIKTSEIEKLDSSVKDFEPSLALDGGQDGLDFYKKIAQNAPKFLKNDGILYLEIGFDQGKHLENLLKDNFCDIEIIKDYDKNDRIIKCRRKQL